MLPARYRMRSSEDFAAVIRGGMRYRSRMIVLYALPYLEAKADLIKVGFVVSKKVGNSVVRHRVVRRLREAIRPFLPFTKPVRVVVRAQPAAAAASLPELEAEVYKACMKLGLISGAAEYAANTDISAPRRHRIRVKTAANCAGLPTLGDAGRGQQVVAAAKQNADGSASRNTIAQHQETELR